MKITVVGRQMSIRDELRELAEKKLAKLDRYFDGEGKATVTFSCKRNRENIEITISAANTLFRCETDGDSFRTAIDRAVETIDRQIRKNKTRLEKRLKRSAFDDIGALPADPIEADNGDFEIRRKSFPFKPMSPEEAILQMNLLGHSFFVFIDDVTEDTCVVYSRKDGNYGLIVPEK